jgi:radical SAM-linked protein
MGNNSSNGTTMRIRVKFAKTEPMRFTSHLDLYRAWERLLRRVDIPLVFSQGFNPRPRLQLAAPLPLGITSQYEIIDFWISTQVVKLAKLKSRLIQAQPPGIDILTVESVDPVSPPLQKKISTAEYIAALLDLTPDLDQKISSLMNSDTIIRQRRGKTYDLRPLIQEISVHTGDDNGFVAIIMRLDAREGSTGRPEEILLALDIPPQNARIERTGLIFKE